MKIMVVKRVFVKRTHGSISFLTCMPSRVGFKQQSVSSAL